MRIKLDVKHHPAENAGCWNDSLLKLMVVGDKSLVDRIEKAIKEALKEKP